MKGISLAEFMASELECFMRNHMQNISFIAIVAVLLGCAFFFSQLSNLGTRTTQATVTSVASGKTLADIPDCESKTPVEDQLDCYVDAVEISQQLLDSKVDEILALESDSDRRMALVELQYAWEASRDADCAYLAEMASDDVDGENVNENACLEQQNLDRLAKLDQIYCEWYAVSPCSSTAASEN